MSDGEISSAVGALDEMPANDASALLESCCGSSEWVRAMLARRPFGSMRVLRNEAAAIWWSLTPDDWLEAFAHHPRIGERDAAVAQADRARDWSADEQRGASSAADEMHAAFAEGNREYEQRFGYIYIVSASGKTAEELLALLRERLSNDPATELHVAAGEQAKITWLRLQKLFAGGGSAVPQSTPRA